MFKEYYILKAKEIFGDIYDYSKIPNEFKITDTIEIICPKHGSFLKRADNHLYKKYICPKCKTKIKVPKKYNTEKFIEKLKKVYSNRNYSFEKVNYKGIDENIIITCKDHGDFVVKARSALHKHKMCPICANQAYSLEAFIEKARAIHGNKYDYSKVRYINATTKVEIVCPVHGSFWMMPVTHTSAKCGCTKCGHGVMSKSEFIKKAQDKWGDFFDYSSVNFNCNSDFIEIICPKHGLFRQRAQSHLRALKKPCPQCRKEVTDPKKFISQAKFIHGDKYDYSEIEFISMSKPVKIICPKHGPFYASPNNHISNRSGCPKCATAYNTNENEVKDYIKHLNFNIIENDRQILRSGPKAFYEIDCYIPDKKLAIEFNGLFWHSESKKGNNYHLKKTEMCEEKGIQLIHIFEDEWIFKKKLVKSNLRRILGVTPFKIKAEKCYVKEISSSKAAKFVNKYHLLGSYNASIRLGLFYKSRLVAVMTFSKPRFNKKYDWELLRFCTLANFNIVGGAQKLFDYFAQKYHGKLVAYSDRRWNDAATYRKLGFNELGSSKPNFWYFLGKRRYSRSIFNKNNIIGKLKNYDSNKSVPKNLIDNGYHKIYDCGNYIFETEIFNK